MTNANRLIRRRALAGVAAGLAASAGLVSGFVAYGAAPVGATPRNGDAIPGAYIVTLAEGADRPSAAASAHGRREGFAAKHVYETAIRGYAAEMSPTAAERLSRRPDVRSVVADRFVSIAGKSGPGSGSTSAQTVPTGVARVGGPVSHLGITDVDVAVIDTGISSHPDLTLALNSGIDCVSGSSTADQNGHGTHVAGTIAANANDVGVVGVAPGARLHAVRVLDRYGNGSWSSIICGVNWVTEHASDIEVANMSLGGAGNASVCGETAPTIDPLHEAVCGSVASGVTYVVAAGNSSADTKGYNPGNYPEVITVSAMTDFNGAGGLSSGTNRCWRGEVDESFAGFSNFGADVDLVAPGVCIKSTAPGGGYAVKSGTSMAAPHVAGAAAIVKAVDNGATPARVRAVLLAAADGTFNRGDDPDAIDEPMLDLATLVAEATPAPAPA